MIIFLSSCYDIESITYMASAPLKNGGFLTIFGVLAILHFWDYKIQTLVPEPYLV